MQEKYLLLNAIIVGALGLSASGSVLAQDAAPEADLPAANTLFQKCFATIGTIEALNAVSSATYSVIPPALMGNATVKVSVMAPDKCRVDATFEGEEAMIVANGEHIWSHGPGEPIEYGGDGETKLIMALFAPQYFLHSAPGRFAATTVGIEPMSDKACYRVNLKKSEQDSGFALFFNTKTGACEGLQAPDDAGDAVTISFDEWQEVEAMKVLTKTTARSNAGAMPPMEFGFTDYILNQVDESIFAMPDDVKKMAEKAKNGDDDD